MPLDGFHRFLGRSPHLADLRPDLFRSFPRLRREALHFRRHYREALSRIPGTRRLDGRVLEDLGLRLVVLIPKDVVGGRIAIALGEPFWSGRPIIGGAIRSHAMSLNVNRSIGPEAAAWEEALDHVQDRRGNPGVLTA